MAWSDNVHMTGSTNHTGSDILREESEDFIVYKNYLYKVAIANDQSCDELDQG